MIKSPSNSFEFGLKGQSAVSRKMIIAVLLAVALVAFEIFNFDTTQYALTNLLGDIRFGGILWASILAIAFCAIDFAGLVRIFTPERGREEPRAVWFLTGAWFLGTIANSVMTWWAVSLTLLSHDFGNEVLSREALLRYVPIFVAMLVWLTRILFIGAFSITGEEMFEMARGRGNNAPTRESARLEAPVTQPARAATTARQQPVVAAQAKQATRPQTNTTATPPRAPVTYEPVDDPFDAIPVAPKTNGGNGVARPASRIQQRPPMPGGPAKPGSMGQAPSTGNMHARSSNSGH
jgi:hypothetical protein